MVFVTNNNIFFLIKILFSLFIKRPVLLRTPTMEFVLHFIRCECGSVLKSDYDYYTLYYILLKDVKVDNSEEDPDSVEHHVSVLKQEV